MLGSQRNSQPSDVRTHHAGVVVDFRDRSDQALEAARDRIDELEEMLRAQRAVFAGDTVAFPRDFRLSPTQEIILGILLHRNRATRDQIYAYLYADRPNGGPDPQVIDVQVCRMRQLIGRFGVRIDTWQARGYYLLPIEKVRLREMITAFEVLDAVEAKHQEGLYAQHRTDPVGPVSSSQP